ncbi:MAG: hypothetical protein WCB99_10570 [Candidatus Cybelea sp.]|jgi:hypothetical protein
MIRQTQPHVHLGHLRHAMPPGAGPAPPHRATQFIVVIVILALIAGLIWVVLQIRKSPSTSKPE